MGKRNYYLLSCEYTPYMCKPIRSSMVISEEVEDFTYRNNNSVNIKEWIGKFVLIQWKPTTKAHYDKLKGNNPGSDSYFYLKREDYRYIDNSCRTCLSKGKCPADHLDENMDGYNCPKGYEYKD